MVERVLSFDLGRCSKTMLGHVGLNRSVVLFDCRRGRLANFNATV
jgi:hypothetical protein